LVHTAKKTIIRVMNNPNFACDVLFIAIPPSFSYNSTALWCAECLIR
jgi:hypothetical protein